LKTAYFERITFYYYPLVLFYISRGYKIHAFNFYHDVARNPRLRCLILENKLTTFFPLGCNKRYGQALDFVEEIYKINSYNRIEDCFSKLLNSSDVNIIIKKSILNEMYRAITINSTLEGCISENDLFIPDSYFQGNSKLDKISKYSTTFIAKKYIPVIIRFISFFKLIVDTIKWRFVAVGFITLKFVKLVLQNIKFFKPANINTAFKFAIPIDQPFQVKFEGQRSFDFICDEKTIFKKDCLFILNTKVSPDWLRDKKILGYNFCDLVNNTREKPVKQKISLELINRFVTALLKYSTTKVDSVEISKSFSHALNEFITWGPLSEYLKIENYIYTNQDGIGQIVKNILLHNNSIQTWNYSSFVGGCLLISPGSDYSDYRDSLWGYQNPTHFLAVNEQVIKYYKMHNQSIKNYHTIGSIYSEMITNLIKNTKLIENEKLNIFKNYKKDTHKILSFFDTTFINDEECLTSYQDGISFYKDVRQIANRYPDYLIIIKPSKNRDFYTSEYSEWSHEEDSRELMELWSELESFENIYFPGDTGDTPLIMAMSDLVVTHCVSSTCVEALGAGVKSIWYESNEKHVNIAYSKIPNLMIHGLEDLICNIDILLNNTTEKQYEEYIEKYIVQEVTVNKRSSALTEFRKLLISG
jgi:polysaccharide biosynthesis PFTS motif protein